jgi:hypothetical protein
MFADATAIKTKFIAFAKQQMSGTKKRSLIGQKKNHVFEVTIKKIAAVKNGSDKK